MDLTLSRIRLAVDAVLARQYSTRSERLMEKEAETRALMMTMLAAAGSEQGAEVAMQYEFFRRAGRPDKPKDDVKRADLGAVAGAMGMGRPLYSQEDIEAARAAKRAERDS